MRRSLALLALTAYLWSPGSAYAGPGGASGPITVDSSTFVAGSSVMGTDGGVYGDNLPPVASTTTAAFRMTKYRAEHVNLRDSSGAEIGTSGNPLFTTASSTITIGNVTVTNSSFSVTGSTVNIQGTVPVSIAATVNTAVTNTPHVFVATTSVSGSTVTVSNTGFAVTNTPTVTVGSALPAGTNNIGLVSGSSVTIANGSGNPVKTSQVNVSTVIVQSMPAVNVNVSTVTITNSTFSIVGVSSVAVIGQVSVNMASPLPAGGNQIGLVSGSTVTIGNPSFTINGTPNVNVLSIPSVTQATPANLKASVSISGSSNTVQAVQSGAWTINSTPVGTSTVTFNGASQPVHETGVSTVTFNGTAQPVTPGAGTRWAVAFSTTTTSPVLASIGTTSSVAISTPIAGVSLQTIRVFRMVLTVDAATTITFRDGSTNFGESYYLSGNGGFVLDLTNEPWYVTSAGNGFVIKQSGSANIGVRLWFTQS